MKKKNKMQETGPTTPSLATLSLVVGLAFLLNRTDKTDKTNKANCQKHIKLPPFGRAGVGLFFN